MWMSCERKRVQHTRSRVAIRISGDFPSRFSTDPTPRRATRTSVSLPLEAKRITGTRRTGTRGAHRPETSVDVILSIAQDLNEIRAAGTLHRSHSIRSGPRVAAGTPATFTGRLRLK